MRFLQALLMLLTMAVVMRADGVPTVVTYVSHEKVTFARGSRLVNDNGLIVLANRRGAGEVEVHKNEHHLFIIVEGEATFVTGGTMINPKETSPGHLAASDVQGGQVHQLRKGDVITIPASTPHWFKEVPTKTIAFYAVNTIP